MPAKDFFSQEEDTPWAPAKRLFNIVPHNVNELPFVTKGIYVAVGGNVTCRSVEGTEDVVLPMPDMSWIDARILIVRATGTTAAGLVAFA